jgi:hypothetical protein
VTRRRVLIGLACLLGAAVVIGPLAARYFRPKGQKEANRALARYIERTRHRSVRDVTCSSGRVGHPGVYFCGFRYGGVNPISLPKIICIRVVAREAREAPCFKQQR